MDTPVLKAAAQHRDLAVLPRVKLNHAPGGEQLHDAGLEDPEVRPRECTRTFPREALWAAGCCPELAHYASIVW
jgi:hypothetical protein